MTPASVCFKGMYNDKKNDQNKFLFDDSLKVCYRKNYFINNIEIQLKVTPASVCFKGMYNDKLL